VGSGRKFGRGGFPPRLCLGSCFAPRAQNLRDIFPWHFDRFGLFRQEKPCAFGQLFAKVESVGVGVNDEPIAKVR